MESRFGPFLDSVSFGARLLHGLCQTYHRLRNHFGQTQWYSYVTRLKWMLVSFRLEIVQTLTQDSCTVCTKLTIGSESFWTPVMVLLGDEAQVEARFSPFGESANLDGR
jgi:hypothetical protein